MHWGCGWPSGRTLLPRVLSCRIWLFYVKRWECNEGDPSEKFDPSRPAFQGHSRSSELTWIGRSATYDFLLMLHSNHGPISYRFRDKRWFQSKVAVSLPVYLAPRWVGSPSYWVTASGLMKIEWWATWPSKKFDIFSRLDTIHDCDRQTDTGQQQVRRVDIASRGKNVFSVFVFVCPPASVKRCRSSNLRVMRCSHWPISRPIKNCHDAWYRADRNFVPDVNCWQTVGRLLCRPTVNFVDPRITRCSLTGSPNPITYILETVESTGPPTVATDRWN